jgi:outer membrane lipoprotein-sorting protein
MSMLLPFPSPSPEARERGPGRRYRTAGVVIAACGALVAGVAQARPATLTASQIVGRFIAARGGLAAWHAVHTMSWSGKLDAGTGDSVKRSEDYVHNMMMVANRRNHLASAPVVAPADEKQVELPFVLDLARPNKSRVEVQFAGKTAVQVYDGKSGWLVRPYLNRTDTEPFTPQEAKAQAGRWDIDGPLMDYAALGSKIALEGMDPVEGHDAYRIRLTTADGRVQHFWIDAKSFLDVKVEGTPRRMDGRMRTVWVYQSDFRSVAGLKVPYELVTEVDGYRDTHRMMIDKVTVNPALSDSLFAKPGA